MKLDSLKWWMNDAFTDGTPLPDQLIQLAPHGPALVSVFGSGATQGGWGLRDTGSGAFMENFQAGKFRHRTKIHALKTHETPFAIVMRSVNAVCIDIDGKNGGLENVGQLGYLPPTLAETSKSGDGFHLFYSLEDEWDEEYGFADVADVIGLVEGVDIRATGCVYHYPQQRWNDRQIVPAPEHLLQRLQHRHQRRAAAADKITKIVTEGDEMDTAMLQSDLINELAKPMQKGGRNNTLFAIGSQMFLAGVDNWDELVYGRAQEVGLSVEESDKLVQNIQRYADKA